MSGEMPDAVDTTGKTGLTPEQSTHQRVLWLVAAISYFLLVALAWSYWAKPITLIEANNNQITRIVAPWINFDLGRGILLLTLIHFGLSWRKVDAIEKGLILFFGLPVHNVGPGLCFVPWLVCELRKASGTVQQFELPGEPEKVWRGKKDGEPLPITEELIGQGWVEPIRINFDDSDPKIGEDIAGIRPANQNETETETDALTKRITVEVPIVVRYRIRNFEKFLLNIGSMAEAKKQLSDLAIAEAVSALEIGTLARAQANRDVISLYITTQLTAHTSDWGIDVRPLRLKPFVYSRELNVSLLEVPKAKAEAQKTVTNAEAKATSIRKLAKAEEEKLTLEGQGRANAVLSELMARGVGLKEIMDQTETDGNAVLAAETIKETMSTAAHTYVAGSGGIADGLHILNAAKAVLQGQTAKKEVPNA